MPYTRINGIDVYTVSTVSAYAFTIVSTLQHRFLCPKKNCKRGQLLIGFKYNAVSIPDLKASRLQASNYAGLVLFLQRRS
jgi:hypothetical protein